MKLCRFAHPQFIEPQLGLIEDQNVFPLAADEIYTASERPSTGDPLPLDNVRLLAPVTPSKIVCVGRNYLEHAAELGNALPEAPLLFLKPPSAIIGPGESIELPSVSRQVEHEGELTAVIGRRARRLPEAADPLAYVLGYTCLNDVTARDLQRRDVQFTRAKSFDTFCPVGPIIVTDIAPGNLAVTTRLNGQIKQHGRTSAMAFSVPFLIRYISHIMTLYPGDLIATGTPAGVSAMKDGDLVEVEVEGIGILRNDVRQLSA